MREAGHIDCSSALGNLVYETQSLLFISGGVAYLFSGAGGIFVLLRAGSGGRTEAMMPSERLPVQHGL